MEFEVTMRIKVSPEVFYTEDTPEHKDSIVHEMVSDAMYDLYDAKVLLLEVEGIKE